MTSDDPRPDPYQAQAPENEGRSRPQYHHDPDKGETRYPPQSGYQHTGVKDERDAHSPLNTPVSEIEANADIDRIGAGATNSDIEGMGRAQQANPGQGDGDPHVGGREPGETKNPAQTTPFGELDAEGEAVRRAEEATGVPLGAGEPTTSGGGAGAGEEA